MVGKLEKCWKKLAQTESNVFLFSELLKRDISTQDIFFFALKQAKIRKVHKKLDPPLSRAAMRSKLNDACAMAIRQRQELKKLKLELLHSVEDKRFKQKRMVKQIRLNVESFKQTLKAKDMNKITRYELLQNRMKEAQENSTFVLPKSLEKFRDLMVFSSGKIVLDGAEIDPPMVCDENISLSQNELLLLSKGPKFSVRKDLKENEFKLEVEKAICKRKYSTFEDPSLENDENPRNSSLKASNAEGGGPPSEPPSKLSQLG